VRKITAGYAIVVVLVGFVYAPLFHVHGGGVHDMDTPVVHAHFPEPEPILPYEAVSSHHSHWAARSIDVLTATAVHVVQIDIVITDVLLDFSAGHICFGFDRFDGVPRTHAPPVLESLGPRAPPL
jgi:uncharacterized protein (UPF0261 family)